MRLQEKSLEIHYRPLQGTAERAAEIKALEVPFRGRGPPRKTLNPKP